MAKKSLRLALSKCLCYSIIMMIYAMRFTTILRCGGGASRGIRTRRIFCDSSLNKERKYENDIVLRPYLFLNMVEVFACSTIIPMIYIK